MEVDHRQRPHHPILCQPEVAEFQPFEGLTLVLGNPKNQGLLSKGSCTKGFCAEKCLNWFSAKSAESFRDTKKKSYQNLSGVTIRLQ
jgi:hypothetical protein